MRRMGLCTGWHLRTHSSLRHRPKGDSERQDLGIAALASRAPVSRALVAPREVAGLRFFPSGDRLLTWAADGRAIVWDTASEEPLLTLDHPGPVECAAVFPAGDRIVTCVGDGSSTIWRASTGEAPPTATLAQPTRGGERCRPSPRSG